MFCAASGVAGDNEEEVDAEAAPAMEVEGGVDEAATSAAVGAGESGVSVVCVDDEEEVASDGVCTEGADGSGATRRSQFNTRVSMASRWLSGRAKHSHWSN